MLGRYWVRIVHGAQMGGVRGCGGYRGLRRGYGGVEGGFFWVCGGFCPIFRRGLFWAVGGNVFKIAGLHFFDILNTVSKIVGGAVFALF